MKQTVLNAPDCPRELLRARIAELEAEVARLRTARPRRDGWSPAEEEILRHGCERRYGFEVIRAELIAKGFGERSTSNIRYRANELGVGPKKTPNYWTDPEDAILRERYAAGDRIAAIRRVLLAAGFNRRFGAIQMRAIHLGISGERTNAWSEGEEMIALAGLRSGKLHREIVEDLTRSGFTRTKASINKLAQRHGLLRPPRPWTDADRQKLRELYMAGTPAAQIAKALTRPVHSIVSKASLLGLSRRVRWSAEENAKLIDASEKGGRLVDVARAIGRPYANVAAQAGRLGLSFQKTRAAA